MYFVFSFHSAASSLNESMMTADEGVVAYLEGLRPSNTDCQVWLIHSFYVINNLKFLFKRFFLIQISLVLWLVFLITLYWFQVYSALESVNVNPEKFPNVHTWMNMVGAVPENERSKWKPIKIQKKTRDLETGRKRLSFDD